MSLASLLAVLALAGGRAEAGRPRIGLRVVVDVAARSVRGHLAAEIENTSAVPIDHLELWRYPARLSRRSPALDEHNFWWVYPHHFDPGAMELSAVQVDGVATEARIEDDALAGPGTLVRLPLAAALLPGQRARVELAFATRVPYRFGPFGCYRGDCTLAGGFYPMPVAQDERGYLRSAPPARADIELVVDSGAPSIVVDGVPVSRGERVRLPDVAWAVLQVGRRFRQATAEHRGVRLVYLHRGGGPPAFLDGDRARLALAEVGEAIDLLHELGLAPPAGAEVRLVQAPMRLEVASPQAGVVLVSDEIYRLFPHRRFRKFHSFQLVGAVYQAMVERTLAAREQPADLALSPAVAAAWLVDLFTVRQYRRKEFAQDILRWVSFIPAIDRILYAPQVPFASAYFNTLDDPEPSRDDLRRFSSDWPRGKVIHEKLRDLLGDRGMTEVLAALWRGTPLRQAAEAVHGGPLDWFFAQWLGPLPDVDYRFEILRRERTPRGYRYHLRLYKRGDHPPVEPVELAITEFGGERQVVRWDGRGRENLFTVETRRLLRAVTLDPRGRLNQSIRSDNDDARLDDRNPGPVKFVYNNFGALFTVKSGKGGGVDVVPDLSLDFTLQRVHDLKNWTRLLVYHSESTIFGGLIGYSRGFGRKVLPSRLSSAFTTSLRVARLDDSFASSLGAGPTPATRISLTATLLHDDRRYLWEPWRYTTVGGSLGYALTVLDDRLRTYQQLSGSLSLIEGFPITPAHTVAFEATLAATDGDLRIPSQALFAGGPLGVVRGYDLDELPGRSYAGLRLEYRHLFVHDLSLNLLYLLYLRGITGGLFAEAALVSPCDAHLGTVSDARHGLLPNLFGDLGYSLRFLGDFLGVSQTMFSVDVAVPLVRRARTCLGGPHQTDAAVTAATSTAHRFPVSFSFYFGPVW